MRFLLCFLFCCSVLNLWGQKRTIEGYVMYENEPVPEANVTIQNSKTYSTTTNSSGYFSIAADFSEPTYTITITHEQFEPIAKNLRWVSGQVLHVSFLAEKEQVLESLVIDQTQKKIRRFADKTVIDVENMTVFNNGSVFDAVNKLPGVMVTANGQIAHNGKLATIFLDGEPTGMSGDQLSNFLKNLPASTVKNIEIIDNPGAKYSATFNGTIINVVTKTAKVEGVSGTFLQNTSLNSRWKNTTSAQFMYKKNGFSWNTNAGYTHHEGNVNALNEFSFETNGNTIYASENYWNQQWYQSAFARNNFQFKVSDATQFTLKYNFNHLYAKPQSMGSMLNRFNDESVQYHQHSKTQTLSNTHELQFVYSQKLDTLGSQLVVTSNTQWDIGHHANGLYVRDALASQIFSDNQSVYSQTKIDFERPLKKMNGNWSVGAHYTHSAATNDGRYFWENARPYVPYEFQYTNQAAYASASATIKKLMVTAGLRFEHLNYESKTAIDSLHIQQTYQNVFPTITLKYPLASGVYWSAGYNKKMNLPAASAFNPNITSRNSLLVSDGGNPFLQPQINHNLSTTLTVFDFIYVSYNRTMMPNQNIIFYEITPQGNLESKYQNVPHALSQNINMGFPLPYAIFTKGVKSLLENRNQINPDELSFTYFNFGWFRTSYDEIIPDQFQKNSYYLFTYSQFYLKNNTRLFVVYYNMFKGVMNLYELNQPAQNLNISLNKKFNQNKWSVTVGVDNVLNTDGFNVNVFGNGVQMRTENWNEKRMFTFGFSYNFGSFKETNTTAFPQAPMPILTP